MTDPVLVASSGFGIACCFALTVAGASTAAMMAGFSDIDVQIDVAKIFKWAVGVAIATAVLALSFAVFGFIISSRAQRVSDARQIDCGCGDARVELELKPDGSLVIIEGCPHRQLPVRAAVGPFVARVRVGDHVFIVSTISPTLLMQEWTARGDTLVPA